MAKKNEHSYDDYDAGDVLAQSKRFAQHLGIKNPSWFGLDLDNDTRNNVVNPLWLTVNSYAQGRWGGSVESTATKALSYLHGKGIGTQGSTWLKIPLLNRALSNPKFLAGACFSLVAASPIFPSIIAPVTTWRKQRADMAKTCTPILRDMKDEGLAGSIGGIGVTDNEVIYAHRLRLNANLSHLTVNNALSLGSSQVGSIINAFAGKKGSTPSTASPNDAAGHSLAHMLPGAFDMVVNKYTASRNKEMQEQQNSCSAYELITNLEAQLKKQSKSGTNPEHRDFSFPKAMGNRSANLADYISVIIRAHTTDMERIMPNDYSQLRDALKPQLKEVSKVLADAIISGDLAPLSLVRMVGEGQIIKQQGRMLVDVEELKNQITKHAHKQASLVEIDPKEYLKMATFKEKELKETLATLQGNERAVFASFFPDTVLKQTGMKDAEIQSIRQETAPMYEKNLANMLAGIAAQPNEGLKEQGMADAEIKAIKDAYKTLQTKGEQAVHTLRANAANPTGIELPLINVAMSKISEPHYFGKMLAAGNELLSEHTKAANDDSAEREGEGEGHRNRPRHNHERAEPHARAEHGEYTRRHRERGEQSEHHESHGSHRG